MLWCFQNGPGVSYALTCSRLKSTRFANGSGRRNVGVLDDSGLVRSTTRIVPDPSAATRSTTDVMAYVLR
jgi:hypothetical protein